MDDLRISKTDKIESFLDRFRTLRAAQRDERLKKMQAFLSSFRQAHGQLCEQGHLDFNVFSLLGIGTEEVKHSRFLAWLLDADADHGQGNLFFKAFIRRCGLSIPPSDLGPYRVQTEFPWAESRVDIMVYQAGKFLIYLENKILAPEGFAQVAREFQDMLSVGSILRIPQDRQFAIFLTPQGKSPTSGDSARWQAISYSDVCMEFAQLLTEITSSKVKFIVKDWLDTVSTFGGANEHAI
jgi:hypothetical protein